MPPGEKNQEPILTPNEKRLVIYPIQHHDVWGMYQKAVDSFWTPGEIDFCEDVGDWQKLSDKEREFLSLILAFFAASDGVVLENLVTMFCSEVQIPEARSFYAFQAAIENVHAETYSLLIETLIPDDEEKTRLLNAVIDEPVIEAKANWALQRIDPQLSFAERLVAFACVEGIMFSSSFCAIFWIKGKGVMKGLSFSNELISRDEGLHTKFACLLYSKLVHRLSEQKVHDIVREAVALEKVFVQKAIPTPLRGINAQSMTTYVEFVADHLCVCLGYNPLYKSKNPFPWMEQISFDGMTQFFERRVGEYKKPPSRKTTIGDTLEFTCEF